MKYNNIVTTLDKAANKMRGKGVKSTDYYNVLLSLVFIKFVTSKAEFDFKKSGAKTGKEFIQEGEFNSEWTIIEQKYFWSNIKTSDKIAIKQNIDKAFISLGKYDKNFKDIAIYNFVSNDITSDTIYKLIEVIEKSFDFDKTEYIDLFGEIYEYFIGKYSANAKRGGEFYTPHSVVKLMTHLIESTVDDKKNGVKVYDPTCGSGGMLVQSLSFLKTRGIKENKMQFFGQELLNETWKIAKMNFALRNTNYNLGKKNADTFSEDLFKDEKFDFILSNPPFNLDFLEEDYADIADTKRFKYGVVFGSKKANYMFFQHVISHLKDDGVGAVVMHSAAGDSKSDLEIRENMIKDNIVESVILLPGDIFKNTSIQSTIWIFNKNKINESILFIDLQKQTKRVNTQEIIQDNVINQSVEIMNSFREGKEYSVDIPSKVVSNEEILASNDKSLNPSRYIINKVNEVSVDKDQVISELSNTLKDFSSIEKDIKKVIELLK